MKRLLLFLIALSLLPCLIACDVLPAAGHGAPAEDYPLFSMVMVGVVGGESKGYVKRLEEDVCGRILFEFAIGNLLNVYYDHGIRGYGICQKIEDGYAYYYEDVFYVGARTLEEIDADEIDALKQRNDWNNQPNKIKVLAKIKSYTNPYEENILDISKSELDSALNTFGMIMGLDSNALEKYDIDYSCKDADGKMLYYIATGEKHGNDASKTSKLYAIIIDPNTTATENSIIQIEDPYDCADVLQAFKQVNGWTPQS